MSKKKPFFPIEKDLKDYLIRHNNQISIPLRYRDLLNAQETLPKYDKNGEDTHWLTMLYPPSLIESIYNGLKEIYAKLKFSGDMSFTNHLFIEEVAFCSFGNSKPFRVKIVNQYNDNHDYFYIKTADSSRVFGLEIEDLLSPNRLNYIVDEHSETLVEEHIIGIPGDMFIDKYLKREEINKVRLAKEFIKFNERCFIRLLGDMRSYNYVLDITPDFDQEQYRVRAIDFDQQSYEGKVKIYFPQHFKENYTIAQFVIENINLETMEQYKEEERALMTRRYYDSEDKIKELLSYMHTPQEGYVKLQNLKLELNKYHKTSLFNQCYQTGEVLDLQLKLTLNL